MKKTGLRTLLLGAVALLMILGGCELVSRDFYRSDEPVPDEGKGMLVLVLDDSEIPSKTLVPSIEMEIETYDILGDHLATPGEPYELNARDVDPDTDEHFIGNVYYRTDMTPGDWAITVIAKNLDGDPIGIGTDSSVHIDLNLGTAVPMPVVPYDYNGSLNLTIQWLHDSISGARVVATLQHVVESTPGNVGSQEGGFSISTGATLDQAVYERLYDPDEAEVGTTGLSAGYYTLWLQLYRNNSNLDADFLWGDTATVRIVSGEMTSSLAQTDPISGEPTPLWDLSSGYGNMSVQISPDLKNPIPIQLTYSAGDDNVTAALVSPPAGLVFNYAWYIDGAQAVEQSTPSGGVDDTFPASGTLSAFALAEALTDGSHNLSVVVTATEGAGGSINSVSSATYPFTVE